MNYPVTSAVLSLLFCSTVNASWLEGHWYWPTKFGRDYLMLEANNNLVYQSVFTMQGETKNYRLFGTWKYQPGVCRSDDKQGEDKNATAEGNLLLHIDTAQCCLNATQLGNQLSLTKLWVKGSGLAIHAYCSDNLLEASESS